MEKRNSSWAQKLIWVALFVVVGLTLWTRSEKPKNSVPTPQNDSIEISEREVERAISSQNPLIGTWEGLTSEGEWQAISFVDDEYLILLDEDGATRDIKYEAIIETLPNELYLYLDLGGGTQRIPFGIYKITGDTLLWRDSIETYHGGGLPDFEMPNDFSQDAIKFTKAE